MAALLRSFTNISEQARLDLDITRDEYALCSYVHYRSADARQKVRGMCCDTKEDIAAFVGVSRRGLYKFIDRMEVKGLLSVDPSTGYISTTAKWVIVENSENKVHKVKKVECEQSSQKVRTKFTESVNKVPRNIEVKEDKYDKGESKERLAALDTPTPAPDPVVEKSETVEAKKEKAPPIPAAPPEATPGPGQSETGDRSQILGLRDRPKAETPAQLREAMQKFYADYPNEWTCGIMELSKGQKYAKEKRAEIVTDWCCHQVEHNQQNNTYQMLNASLQKWFRNQERAESWKGSNSGSAPGNSDNLRYQAPKPNEITPAYVP